MNNYILLLTIFTIGVSILDFYTNKYYSNKWNTISYNKKIKLILLLLFHNIIYFIIYLSVFFIYKAKSYYILLYLIFLIIVLFHWKTNDNKCKLTELQNQLLGIDNSTGFRDLYSIVTNTYSSKAGSGTIRDNLYTWYIYIVIIYTSIIFFFPKVLTKSKY